MHSTTEKIYKTGFLLDHHGFLPSYDSFCLLFFFFFFLFSVFRLFCLFCFFPSITSARFVDENKQHSLTLAQAQNLLFNNHETNCKWCNAQHKTVSFSFIRPLRWTNVFPPRNVLDECWDCAESILKIPVELIVWFSVES